MLMVKDRGEYLEIGNSENNIKIPTNCVNCSIYISFNNAYDNPDMEGEELKIVWGDNVVLIGRGENLNRVLEDIKGRIHGMLQNVIKFKKMKESNEALDEGTEQYLNKMLEFIELNGIDGGSLADTLHTKGL